MSEIEKIIDGLAYENPIEITCEKCLQKSVKFCLVPKRVKGIKNSIVCLNCAESAWKEFLGIKEKNDE